MDGYPDEWRRNGALSLPARRDDLVGLAEKVGEAILRDPPGLVVCGSRGGQVTIGLVWRYFWRGPTVVINGGCLLTETWIPENVFPVFVTMEKDYFSTANPAVVAERFAATSDVSGIHVHLRGEKHIPMRLFEVFLDIVRAAKTQRVPELPQWASARALPQSTPGTPAPRTSSARAPPHRSTSQPPKKLATNKGSQNRAIIMQDFESANLALSNAVPPKDGQGPEAYTLRIRAREKTREGTRSWDEREARLPTPEPARVQNRGAVPVRVQNPDHESTYLRRAASGEHDWQEGPVPNGAQMEVIASGCGWHRFVDC